VLTGKDGEIRLSVEDHGVGFDTERARGVGLGLASMSERAHHIRADFEVDSRPGRGTVVRVRATLGRSVPPR
jgi:signal transduction histidine kinase